MDVERTIEFILQAQARTEINMQKAEARMEKMDKRIDGIAKLIRQGMQMLVKTDATMAELVRAQKRTEVKLQELAQAQKETEKSLKAFMDSLRTGRNGKNNR